MKRKEVKNEYSHSFQNQENPSPPSGKKKGKNFFLFPVAGRPLGSGGRIYLLLFSQEFGRTSPRRLEIEGSFEGSLLPSPLHFERRSKTGGEKMKKYKLCPVWRGYLVEVGGKWIVLTPYQTSIYAKVRKVPKNSEEGKSILREIEERYGKKFI